MNFIVSPELEDGPHSVVIMNAGDDTDASFVFAGLLVSSFAPVSQPLLLNGLASSTAPSAGITSNASLPPNPSNTAPSQPAKESTHSADSQTPSVVHSTAQSVFTGSSTLAVMAHTSALTTQASSVTIQTSAQATSEADKSKNLPEPL